MKIQYVIALLAMGVGVNTGKIWFEGDLVPGTNYTIGPQESIPAPDWIKTSIPAQSVSAPLPPNTEVVVSRGVGRLALQLQSVIGKPGKNTVFSPLSLALAMALVILGARGNTYSELTTALGLSNNTDEAVVKELHNVFGGLFQSLEKETDDDHGVILTLASGIFVQKDFFIEPQYSQVAKNLYKSEVMSLDFLHAPGEAKEVINKWVENRTDGHISNILTESLSIETRVVLVNAIFFNGNWETPFPRQFTKKQKFYINQNEAVEVDMMVNVAEAYYSGDNYKKVLGLPYKGRETIMYFVLPTTDLASFVSLTTPFDLQVMVKNSTLVTTIYTVPKMKLQETLSLQESLRHLGVHSLFNPSLADLSGLARGVYVNNVIQKVEVIIDEIGTTASAATVVDLVRSGGPVVRLDKPFLFFIYDVPSGLVSFWGTVYNPTQLTP